MRLNKFLSQSGLFSRRSADEAINNGDIFVNSNVAILGQQIDPAADKVCYQDKQVKIEKNKVYYALYKPKGVISTASDELNRQTVLDFVPKKPHVYPVGRLDEDSEGLIILTNDGELTQKLTHPGFEHEKEYEVQIKHQTSNIKMINQEVKNIKERFEDGLLIDGKLMKADRVLSFQELSPHVFRLFTFNVVLHTGYNRQIRKMCAKIGLEVLGLKRIRIGKLKLSNLKLKPGEYKETSRCDIIES